MKHIVLLTIDCLRKDVVGCYGGGKLTPFLDSLQDKMIRYERAYSTGPYTKAGFPGILTSSYYLDYPKQKMLSTKRTLISEAVHKHGIHTAAFHSNAYLSEYFGWNRGYDHFYDSMEMDVSEKYPYLQSHELQQKLRPWMADFKKSQDKPLFLWIHYMDVHEPYVPKQKYLDYVDSSIKMTDDEMFSLFKDVLLKRDISNKENVELLKKLYMAHVKEVDEGVKEFFGILKENNMLDDTVVIFTADHGDEFGEHGGLSHDGKFFDELVNVPLMIYDPSLEKGRVIEEVVSTVDIGPSIVHLFDLPPEENFAGQSLLPVEKYDSRGAYGDAADKVGSHEKGDEPDTYFYRGERFKVVYKEKDDSWQLYDLVEDPGETRNIISSSPHTEEMQEKLKPRIKRYSNKS